MSRLFLLFFASLVLSSCSPIGRAFDKLNPTEEDKESKEDGGVPDFLLPGHDPSEDKTAIAEARVVSAGVDPAKTKGLSNLPSEDEILFLDPDDAEGAETALSGLSGMKKKEWVFSHSVARNYALSEGKPLLIFFANTPTPKSGGSSSSARIEKELFARNDFADWASERFIRLKLEFNVKNRNSADTKKKALAVRKLKYLNSLKERYHISGLPVVLVLAADGSEVQRIVGFRSGRYEYTWGLLRTAEINAKERLKSYEKSLAKKGYRRWTGKNEQRIFARLAAYQDGELTLIEPNGARHVTQEKSLSREDQKWLAEEKKKAKLGGLNDFLGAPQSFPECEL